PVRHYFPDSRWKEILTHKNMELVIAIDVLPSDTTAYADVILPNSTYLERSEPNIYANGVNHDLGLTTRYAAIDPLYDTREIPDILMKMTEIISGQTDSFIDHIDKLTGLSAASVRKQLPALQGKTKNPLTVAYREAAFDLAAEEAEMTKEQLDTVLREKGVCIIESKERLLDQHAMPRKMPLPSPSGRVEFYSGLFDGLRKMGGTAPQFAVLATHIPTECRSGAASSLADDEFYFTYGKAPTVSYASTNNNNPVLAAINKFKEDIYTHVWIHPSRAAFLNIVEGDPIQITNTKSGQTASGHAHITRLIHREAIFLYSSFGAENPWLTRSHGVGTATNKLIPYNLEPVTAGFRSQEFTVRIKKAVQKGGVA
ncbi:MAG TPA: molybdopterin dinucleotide binding domain-containing protein, partial [Rhodocyclaceae bacterium]